MSIIEKIPTLSDNELTQLLFNTLKLIAQAESGQKTIASIDDAKRVVQAIEVEWIKRTELAQAGADRPKVGILGALGYHVGKSGLSLRKRRPILSFILGAPYLPAVGSPAYLLEWAEPNSPERLQKMATVIANLAREKIAFGEERYADAILHWEADLEWLWEEYYKTRKYRFNWPRIRN